MVGVRQRGETIRLFILDNVESNSRDISRLTVDAFGISRQAVNKHLQYLVRQGALSAKGSTRNRDYVVQPLVEWEKVYSIDSSLIEDRVWREDIGPLLGGLPDNVMQIWQYGFTEMFNNVLDHSAGKSTFVRVEKTARVTEIGISDDGVGIFKKIQDELGLIDERHAVLELSKGKITTDPERHTGEGVFFSSRMFDDFAILSGTVYFSHTHAEIEDWILERQKFESGTSVFMKLRNNSSQTMQKVFAKFTAADDFGFTKTVVPVRLARYGDELLISRSQAKRLLARLERFKIVILDFEGVETIGQAFADEVFRVFTAHHSKLELVHIKANSAVKRMIARAQSLALP